MDITQALRWRRAAVATAAAVALTAVGANVDWSSGNGQPRLVASLQSFEACDDLLDYVQEQSIEMLEASSGGDEGLAMQEAAGGARESTGAVNDSAAMATVPTTAASAAPVAGVDFSATNVQEAGVDEPDTVKTDGRRLVTVATDGLRIVDLTGAEPALAGHLDLGTAGGSATLLMKGDRVLVLAASEARPGPASSASSSVSPSPAIGMPAATSPEIGYGSPGATVVTTVDIADAARPKIVAELTLDGSLVAARLVGDAARLVLRSGPVNLPYVYPTGPNQRPGDFVEANRQVVADSTIDDWLPHYSYTEPGRPAAATTDRLVGCDAVSRPPAFSGLDMVSVLSVGVDDPRPGPAATVLGAGEIVYASAEHLYVTSTVYDTDGTTGSGVDVRSSRVAMWASPAATQIHEFDITDPVRTAYLASGSIPGHLLNSFSLSEHDGHLRAASTTDGSRSIGMGTGSASQSSVMVLRRNGETLDTVGQVDGLGKGERIYAVRFMGDRGYVVTFRQTDPLYVLDLSDATKPLVTGELKVPGYSAYLHPVGDHRLLGVGQAANDQGRVQGTQLSLFDVSDSANPQRLANATLPASTRSEAEYDHHAFLYWPATGLTVVPVQSFDRGRQVSGAVGFTVTGDAIAELGRIERQGLQARRSLVVGDRVLTLFEGGLQTNDLATLAPGAWLSL